MKAGPPFGTWLLLFGLFAVLIVSAYSTSHHPAVSVPGSPNQCVEEMASMVCPGRTTP